MMRQVHSVVRVVAVVAFILLVVAPPTAGAAATSAGTAATSDTLVSVDVGDDSVVLGADSISSERSTERLARASLVLGSAGGTEVGSVEREAASTAENDSEGVSTEAIDVAGLVTLEPSEGELSVEVLASRVTASLGATLGAADVLEGLVTLGGGGVETLTKATDDQSRAERSITIEQIEILNLGALLDALDVDPLSLACDALEAAGALLDVDTADACEELAAAEDAIDDASTVLGDAAADAQALLDEVQADYDAVSAIADGLGCGVVDLTCVTDALATIQDVSDTYELGLTIPDPLDVLADPDPAGLLEDLAADAADGVQPYLDAATSGDGAIDAAVAALGETCESVADAAADAADAVDELVSTFAELDALADDVTALSGDADAIDALLAALDAACDALQSILDTLLDTTLLTLGDVEVEMLAVAREDDPSATITGQIGSVTVGATEPVDLPVDLGAVEDLQDTIGGLLEDVTDALGIGLPTPELEFLAQETDEGKRDDTWFAEATLTAVRVRIPSATLEVPDVDPLGILDDGAEIGASVGPTPEIEVNGVVFDASAELSPDVIEGDSTNLPNTGLGDEPLAGIGAALLVAATLAPTLVRRLLRDAD